MTERTSSVAGPVGFAQMAVFRRGGARPASHEFPSLGRTPLADGIHPEPTFVRVG